MGLFKHDHSLASLPDQSPLDSNGDRGMTCPATLADGTVCGKDMAFAHSVREFHPVRHWTADSITLGEANEFDAAEDEDPHLWCAAGHDWAVPVIVELD